MQHVWLQYSRTPFSIKWDTESNLIRKIFHKILFCLAKVSQANDNEPDDEICQHLYYIHPNIPPIRYVIPKEIYKEINQILKELPRKGLVLSYLMPSEDINTDLNNWKLST